jgi:hypothetical protein
VRLNLSFSPQILFFISCRPSNMTRNRKKRRWSVVQGQIDELINPERRPTRRTICRMSRYRNLLSLPYFGLTDTPSFDPSEMSECPAVESGPVSVKQGCGTRYLHPPVSPPPPLPRASALPRTDASVYSHSYWRISPNRNRKHPGTQTVDHQPLCGNGVRSVCFRGK